MLHAGRDGVEAVHFGVLASRGKPYKPRLSNRGGLWQETKGKIHTKGPICDGLQGDKSLLHITPCLFYQAGQKQHIGGRKHRIQGVCPYGRMPFFDSKKDNQSKINCPMLKIFSFAM